MLKEEKILSCGAYYAKCPVCGVNKEWQWEIFDRYMVDMDNYETRGKFTKCKHCGQTHIFYNEELVYPRITTHVKPHELFINYSKSQKLFNESLAVASDSPRAGLTLSRMCLECLVNEILIRLEETPNGNFKANIEKLLELDIINNRVKKLLDDTRVIGNKSTHNFNLIDTENEVTLDDCMLVWKAINHILESLKIAQELDSDISNLKDKVKEN